MRILGAILREGAVCGAILILAGALTAAARFNHRLENLALKETESRIRDEVSSLEREVGILERRLQALEAGDPFIIEKRIRDRFGYVRPGEVPIPPPASR